MLKRLNIFNTSSKKKISTELSKNIKAMEQELNYIINEVSTKETIHKSHVERIVKNLESFINDLNKNTEMEDIHPEVAITQTMDLGLVKNYKIILEDECKHYDKINCKSIKPVLEKCRIAVLEVKEC